MSCAVTACGVHNGHECLHVLDKTGTQDLCIVWYMHAQKATNCKSTLQACQALKAARAADWPVGCLLGLDPLSQARCAGSAGLAHNHEVSCLTGHLLQSH